MDYADIRLLHITSACISISLFLLRGALQFSDVNWRRWRLLCIAPHVNDTVLLSAAIALAWISQQYPWQLPWLGAKVLALLLYIALGQIAFRNGTPRRRQALAFGAAVATVAYIVLVAISRSATMGLG